jgi:ring-1,2-phenylacetyl-CoA epoxidase subunit PaaE
MSLNASFHSLRIADIRRETADSVSLRFDIPPALKSTFAFEAGQHLTLRAEIGGEDVRRSYSICSSAVDDEIRIAVKRMPGGKFSSWANNALSVGQSIDVLPPMGRFVPPRPNGAALRYVGLAGGSGITPIISILKTVLQTQPQSRFTLLYGNRDTASIMFLEELAGLKDRYLDRLEIYHFLENEVEEIALFNGRIDHAKCSEVLSTLIDVKNTDAFFICGPGPMMDAVEAALDERGVPTGNIFVERFTTVAFSAEQIAKNEALQQSAAGATLSVTLDGRSSIVRFDATASSILESVQAAGMDAPYACKGGVCTTCRARIVSGTVTMKKNYGLTEYEVAQGYVLTCQAVPTSDQVALSYDA